MSFFKRDNEMIETNRFLTDAVADLTRQLDLCKASATAWRIRAVAAERKVAARKASLAKYRAKQKVAS